MNQNDNVLPAQKALVDFLISSKVLQIGDFTTKSGRNSPYFLNFGMIDRGKSLHFLADLYAEKIKSIFDPLPNVIFGPSYKGIPLAVAISMSLDAESEEPVYFSFNRKEKKQHGEKGSLVGRNLSDGDRVVIVEDVLTAGTTFREVVPLIESCANVTVQGAIIAVDRMEKVDLSDTISARDTIQKELDLAITPLITIKDVIRVLTGPSSPITLDDEYNARITEYMSCYGA